MVMQAAKVATIRSRPNFSGGRWDSLSEVEQAEALISTEGARPPGHEASEEETAKANESHVYDEDGIRVFE